jgi:TPR repeat protein
VLFFAGRGVPQDYAQAATWTRKAAEQGDATAEAELGAAYLLGEGVPKDYSEAYFWFRIAETGHVQGIDPKTGHEITHDEMTALLTEAATHLTPSAVSEAEARAAAWLAASPGNQQ